MPPEVVETEVFGGGAPSERTAFLERITLAAAAKADYDRAAMLKDNAAAIAHTDALKGVIVAAQTAGDAGKVKFLQGVLAAALSLVKPASPDADLLELWSDLKFVVISEVDKGHYTDVEIIKNLLDAAFWPDPDVSATKKPDA